MDGAQGLLQVSGGLRGGCVVVMSGGVSVQGVQSVLCDHDSE